jgi:hypothetical protein
MEWFYGEQLKIFFGIDGSCVMLSWPGGTMLRNVSNGSSRASRKERRNPDCYVDFVQNSSVSSLLVSGALLQICPQFTGHNGFYFQMVDFAFLFFYICFSGSMYYKGLQ